MQTDNLSKRSHSQTASGKSPAQHSIRYLLLVAMNATLAGLVVLFLVYDYQSELEDRLKQQRYSLEDEALTLMPAVLRLRQHGLQEVQQYIDTVCGQMQDSHSPGHHIALRLGQDTIQATAHHRSSPQMLQAMTQASQAPDRRARIGTTEFIVGTYQHEDAMVYVSESLDMVRRSLRGDLLRRFTGFLVLAVVAALVVNLVLVRMVTLPLNRLVRIVREIAHGDFEPRTTWFRSTELDYLGREVHAMAASLKSAQRYRTLQMARAREIQQNLLPQAREIPGLMVDHLFQPADDVGGDFYDIVQLPDGAVLFCVADVAGHGIPAAMTATVLKALLLTATEQFENPVAMLSSINRQYTKIAHPDDFVTMLLVKIDVASGQLIYASAGHETAWLRNSVGETRELISTGLILGVLENTTWTSQTMEIAAGDRLLMVTDGVTENLSPGGDLFGRSRTQAILDRYMDLPVTEAVRTIDHRLSDFRQGTSPHDDITVLLVEVTME